MSQDGSSKEDLLEANIAHLQDLDLRGLRVRWRNLTGNSASAHLPRHLLARMMAYRMQADRYGDLSVATIRLLAKLSQAGQLVPPVEVSSRPGTVLIREWEGVAYHVTALRSGYSWNGTTYKSLSEVARAITGTHWSGPRFFGLRERKP